MSSTANKQLPNGAIGLYNENYLSTVSLPQHKDQMSPEFPGKIGEWRVLNRIGNGVYGDTFTVKRDDSEEGERFALKWMRPDAEPKAAQRFQNEAWALQQLDHRGIPKFVAEGAWEQRPFIVMTLAPGHSLKKIHSQLREEGALFGEVRVLGIAAEVLDALAHMHSRNILHRDVKDDNILTTESENRVTLVDLGVCKGIGQPSEIHTFRGGVGAARFCPPSKLQHPSLADPSHDVFAVGVTSYLLLTGSFPWAVRPDEDVTTLAQKMVHEIPEKIHELNNRVSRETSDFVHALLDIDDTKRPTAEFAKNEALRLRTAISQRAFPPELLLSSRVVLSRVVRDSVHGDIRMTEFEWAILNTPEFQRLRWVKQLGLSNFVYPSAEHTRLAHALGTMHIADRILRSIEERSGQLFQVEDRLRARAYALIHDLGHIAFGHTLEDELGFFPRHDENEGRLSRLLLSGDSGVGKLLRSIEYGREVLAHFDSRVSIVRNTWLRELVEAPYGADVLDYVDRDSHHCGLDHHIDSAVYRRFTLGSPDRADPFERRFMPQVHGHHGLRLDAEFALESILRERFALFLKVYTHPVKVAAGAMLGKALFEVLDTTQRGGRRATKRKLTERQIEWLGDAALLTYLRGSDNAMVARLADRLLERRLYRAAYRARALNNEQLEGSAYRARQDVFVNKNLVTPAGRRDLETEIARKSNVKPEAVIVYCTRSAPGLQKVRQFVEVKPGTNIYRDEVHEPHRRMMRAHYALWYVYVFVPPELDVNQRNRVSLIAESLIELPDEQGDRREQMVLFG